MKSYFPVVQIVSGGKYHYVDDYRNLNHSFTICSSKVIDGENALFPKKSPAWMMCQWCIKRANSYPTEKEFFEYHACTDCGFDVWFSGHGYGLKTAVWDLAYPGYSSGVGVGNSRPCYPCLESRLGRELVAEDFSWYVTMPDSIARSRD